MKNFKFLVFTILIAGIYFLLIMVLMNNSLIKDTFLNNYKLVYKIKIVSGLIQGMSTSMSGIGLFLLISIALLTGLNLTLLFEKLKDLRNLGNLKIVVGGSSIFGIVSSGCAACGLPILTLLGLGGSVVFLPLRGVELSYISILMLSFSLYLLVKPAPVNNCNINKYE